MVTRRWMATPAIFVFLVAVMLLGLVTLGIVTWHLASSGNAPVAVDWGNKVCKQSPDGNPLGKCKKPDQQAVDWGNSKCIGILDSSLTLGNCKPGKPPKQVAVDWGDSMSICVPNPDGGCGPVEGPVVWGDSRLTS